MNKRSIILFVSALWALTTVAQGPQRVPATPYPIEAVQPNGDTLMIRLIGDEHYHYRTTLDGWLIKQNDKGWYCYARHNKKGGTKVTRRKAHNEAGRSRCEMRFLERKGERGETSERGRMK